MDLFNRGVELYLLVIALIGAIAVVWGANRFLLGNTATGTGWSILIGFALVLVTVGLVIRRLKLPAEKEPDQKPPW